MCLLATGCLDEAAVTVDDVIPRLEVVTPESQRVADGKTPIELALCRTADSGVAKDAKATLETSSGAWLNPGAEDKKLAVSLAGECETRFLVPTTESGTVTVSATIDSYTRTTSFALAMAPIAAVRLSRQGVLSDTDTAMLTITANLDVAGNGKPSTNTLVSFTVVGGTAWFSERQPRVVQGASSVQTNLYVAAGATALTVLATASPDNQTDTPSESLVIAK